MKMHGPFDIYRCGDCLSTFTFPLPSDGKLAAFYSLYADGLPDELIAARRSSPQTAMYEMFVDRIVRFAKPAATATWYDVAAGTAIFTQLMSERLPASTGVGIDFHPRPAALTQSNVRWRQGDLNGNDFDNLAQGDVVVALAVLEHVLQPRAFMVKLISLVKPGGLLYVMCPDSGSWMARLLQRHWPYYSPGEHLNVPTIRGARALVESSLSASARTAGSTRVAPLSMPYTLQYLAAYVHLPMRGLIPRSWALPIPAGILEIAVRVH